MRTKEPRFKVGDKVRRSPRWWKGDVTVYVVTAVEIGEDNSGRKQQGYRIRPVRSRQRPDPYLECELVPA